MSEQMVCGYAVGEDRNAESDDEKCGYKPAGPLDWMNHVDLEHHSEDPVDCPYCGDATKWSKRMLPTIDFYNGNESVGVCLGCQDEIYNELAGS